MKIPKGNNGSIDVGILKSFVEAYGNYDLYKETAFLQTKTHDPVTGAFLPGNNLNPGGRPKGSGSLTKKAIEFLHRPARAVPALEGLAKLAGMDVNTCTVGEVVSAVLVLNAATSNNAAFILELLNRVDGRVKEVVEVHSFEEKSQALRGILQAINVQGAPPETNGSRIN